MKTIIFAFIIFSFASCTKTSTYICGCVYSVPNAGQVSKTTYTIEAKSKEAAQSICDERANSIRNAIHGAAHCPVQ
jgi:hypothetical protein